MPGHCQLQNKLSFKTKRGEHSTASHDYKVEFISKPGLLHPVVVPWSTAEFGVLNGRRFCPSGYLTSIVVFIIMSWERVLLQSGG